MHVLLQERYLSVQAFTNIADNCFQVCTCLLTRLH